MAASLADANPGQAQAQAQAQAPPRKSARKARQQEVAREKAAVAADLREKEKQADSLRTKRYVYVSVGVKSSWVACLSNVVGFHLHGLDSEVNAAHQTDFLRLNGGSALLTNWWIWSLTGGFVVVVVDRSR